MAITARILLTGGLVALGVFGTASPASAHRDGCHRWHSCPSDSGSYVCGDTGYSSECGLPTSTPTAEYVPPTYVPPSTYPPPTYNPPPTYKAPPTTATPFTMPTFSMPSFDEPVYSGRTTASSRSSPPTSGAATTVARVAAPLPRSPQVAPVSNTEETSGSGGVGALLIFVGGLLLAGALKAGRRRTKVSDS
jgi:hypothetical protein